MSDQETREKILAAAMTVFAEKGFAKASMNDIVHTSGLSKGGVYWHFASKNDLLVAVFEQFFSAQVALLDTVLAQPGSASERLICLGTLAGEDISAFAGRFPSPLEFYALAARDDVLHRTLQSYFHLYQQRLTMLVEQGMASGEFRAGPTAEITHTLIGLFEGLLLAWVILPTTIDLTQQLESSLQLLLKGLRSS